MRHGASDQAGFTLIEMIVVIVIMAMMGGLVLVKRPWQSSGVTIDATVQTLTNTLRLARSRAIAQNRESAVVTGPNGFSIDGGAVKGLPPSETLSASQIIFTPDGGSSGVTILLSAGERRIAIDVNWMTGRVRSHEINTK